MALRIPTRAVATPNDDPDLRSVQAAPAFVRLFRRPAAWVLLLDIALIALFTALSPNNVFWSIGNFQALALQSTQLVLISIGIAVFMSAGFIDISVGANLVLSSVIGAKVLLATSGSAGSGGDYSNWLVGILLSLIACVVAGLVFGLINGFIIAVLGVNSLITTLGTMGIAGGVSLLLTSGTEIGNLPFELQEYFGTATLGPIPLPAVLAVALVVIAWLFYRFTSLGTHTLAIGSSRASAERSGIRVRTMIISLAALSGVLAGLAGFVSLAQYGSTTISGHTNDALAAITAVVIGGTILEGGRTSIVGMVFGVALAEILQSGLVIIGVQAFWQLVAIGVVLIVAVTIDRIRYWGRSS